MENDPDTDMAALAARITRYQSDALAFVREVFGIEPTAQQAQLLNAVSKEDARVSVKSGHGVGKTASLALVVLWHVSVFPDSKVACTAPTGHQLNDLLWAEIAKWHKKMHPYFADQIEVRRDTVQAKDDPAGRFAVARTSRKENPEALQGFHASHMLYLVDEASGVPDQVFEPMRGALSTRGSRVVLAANPTRVDGFFHRTHHKLRDMWTRLQFSCLDSPMVGKEYIAEMKADYGEDSDIYRVRVLGDFPRASICQLIPTDLVERAQKVFLREEQYRDSPVILGVDVAHEGDDCTVIYLRRGLYSKMLGRWNGLSTMDTADRAIGFGIQYGAAATFVDIGGVGAGVVDRMRQLRHQVTPVNFGQRALKEDLYHNKRAEMWWGLKDWLELGGALEDIPDMQSELTAPQYFMTPAGKRALESKKDIKKRGLPSPDRSDALALTFAMPVRAAGVAPKHTGGKTGLVFTNSKYNPLGRR